MRHTHVVALTALATILTGCLWDEALFPANGSSGSATPSSYPCYYDCVDLGIRAASSATNFLVGDSMSVYSHSTRVSGVAVTWSTKSPGVSFSYRAYTNGQTMTGQTITGVPLYSNVYVKATVVGKDTISVATSNPAYTGTMAFVVSDSASMTYLRILASTTQVKVGSLLYLSVALKDSSGNEFRARPTWTSLDPATLKITPDPATYYNASSATGQGMKAGSTKVVASFGSLSDTLLVTVTP